MRESGAVSKPFNEGEIFAEDRALLMEFELDYRIADTHSVESLSSEACSIYSIYHQGSGSGEYHLYELEFHYLTYLMILIL